MKCKEIILVMEIQHLGKVGATAWSFGMYVWFKLISVKVLMM
jgi:hypothetical protein